jgi:hypothetical protein
MSRICSWLSSTVLLFLAGTLLEVAAAATEPAPAFHSIPGGVADRAGKRGCVVGVKGTIESLDLANGKRLWESKEQLKPLAFLENQVVAQKNEPGKANQVRIVVLASATGKVVKESDVVVFPEWVSTGLTHGRSFTSHGRIDNGDLFLIWQARGWYAGGARPSPAVERRERKAADGVFRIKLKTGKVEAVAADKVPAVKLPKGLPTVSSDLYYTETDSLRSPFVVGSTVLALTVKNQPGGKQKMSLKRWDRKTGKALDTVDLLTGKSLIPVLSLDGAHLLVHPGVQGNYDLWVFSLERGKQLAKLRYQSGGRMAVVGGLVLQNVPGPAKSAREQSLTLRAVDLKTGKQLWARAVEPNRTLQPRR